VTIADVRVGFRQREVAHGGVVLERLLADLEMWVDADL
jgi:hypothetical protein